MDDLKQKAVRGGLVKLTGQALNFAVRMSSLMIVARLLEPADFGLVAMVTSITEVYGLFRDGGLSAASIQQANITQAQKSALFWINMLVGGMLTVICILTAPVIAHFYGEPRLFWITIALSSGFIIDAAGAQHHVILERQLRYTELTLIDAFNVTACALITIVAAVAGFGYWSMVISTAIWPVINTGALWATTRWKPGLPRRNARIASMLHFGGAVALSNIVSYVTSSLDKVLLGRFWGADALGLYGRAMQMINIPISKLNGEMGTIAFSALSRLQHDPPQFKNYFLKGYGLVMTMTAPITLFSAAFADDITLVILGPKWIEAATIFRLLTPTVLILGIIKATSWLLLSLGLQRRNLAIGLVVAPLCIMSYLIGLPYGPQGIALAYSTAMALWVVPHLIWCLKDTMISVREFLLAMGPAMGSAAMAVAVAFVASSYVGHLQSPFWRLLFAGCVMGGVYVCMLLFIMGQKGFYLGLLSQLWTSRRP
ncbi:lipopolysaccharide biosynthesis protein [Methylocapsa polymorpha]|uniref:Lipopolysaccharide biosynthesis protein n=1 Tax=Methylocapsa polymorpha TaxID=3080828 RepID=A0ABZ0HWF1_9HYPH|nr:lipopolysaccharide biosynthesis protein [Methylocapsa sp. RX1]